MNGLNENTADLRDEYLRREDDLARIAANTPELFIFEMKSLLESVEGATTDDRENALLGFLAMNVASLYGWAQRSGFSDYRKFTAIGLDAASRKEVA